MQQVMISDHAEREFPIIQIRYDKLNLVLVVSQTLEIRPVISFRLPRCGALHIENYGGSWIDLLRRHVSAGFDQDLITTVAKLRDERKHIPLCEWLTAGYFNQPAAKFFETLKDVFERDRLSARERIFAITPRAPHRAARQPHERTRASGMGRFALDREKYFRNSEFHQMMTKIITAARAVPD